MRIPQLVFRALAIAALFAFCLPFAVGLEGCTVIGLVAGAAADAQRSGGSEKLLQVEPGRSVTLVMWDKHTIQGRFVGLVFDSAGAAPADSGTFVAPRDASVRIATKSGEVRVPAESVARVVVAGVPAALVGMLAGLTIDAMILQGIHEGVNEPSCEGPNPDFSLLSTRAPAPARGGVPVRGAPPAPAADAAR